MGPASAESAWQALYELTYVMSCGADYKRYLTHFYFAATMALPRFGVRCLLLAIRRSRSVPAFPRVSQVPASWTERTTCGDLDGSSNFFCRPSARSLTKVLPSADCV